MNAYKRIRQGMRQNEVELLTHLRKNVVSTAILFGNAWWHALDRLLEGKMVRFQIRKGGVNRYVVRKGARPVTGVCR